MKVRCFVAKRGILTQRIISLIKPRAKKLRTSLRREPFRKRTSVSRISCTWDNFMGDSQEEYRLPLSVMQA